MHGVCHWPKSRGQAGQGALGCVGHGAGPVGRAGGGEVATPASVPTGPCSGRNTVLRDSHHRGRAAFHLRHPPSVPLCTTPVHADTQSRAPREPTQSRSLPRGVRAGAVCTHSPSPPGRGADPAALPGRREPPGGKALHTCRSRAVCGARSPCRCSGRPGAPPSSAPCSRRNPPEAEGSPAGRGGAGVQAPSPGRALGPISSPVPQTGRPRPLGTSNTPSPPGQRAGRRNATVYVILFIYFFTFSFEFPSVHAATEFMHVRAPSVAATSSPNPKAFSFSSLTCTAARWSCINSSFCAARLPGPPRD